MTKIYGDEEKPSLQEIAHHGVKGMHWGVRKAAPVTEVRKADIDRFGKRGATRIARNQDKGLTNKQAMRKEQVRAVTKAGLAVGAYLLSQTLSQHGGTLMTNVSNRANTNRERAKITAIASKAAKVNYAKKRRGAYKISSL
jgi:hypothetical protein